LCEDRDGDGIIEVFEAVPLICEFWLTMGIRRPSARGYRHQQGSGPGEPGLDPAKGQVVAAERR